MPDTIYWTATSLDGFIADEDHSLDWLFEVPRGPNHPDRFTGFFDGVGAIIMGSTTFEWVVTHEGMRSDPQRWETAFGGRPCWVFTSRDLEPLPGDLAITFESGDVRPPHAAAVAAAGDRDVWLTGGGDLVGQFDDAGLLDVIEVDVQPVLLGSGAPLLPRRITSRRLELDRLERIGHELHARYLVGPATPAAEPDDTSDAASSADASDAAPPAAVVASPADPEPDRAGPG